MRVIEVRPVGGEWVVSEDGAALTERFTSGARAEAAARQRMRELSKGGSPSELRIFLRDGSLAGKFVAVPAVLEPA